MSVVGIDQSKAPVTTGTYWDTDSPALFSLQSTGGVMSARSAQLSATGAIHESGYGRPSLGWATDTNARDRGPLDRVDLVVEGSDGTWSRLAYTDAELDAAAASATWSPTDDTDFGVVADAVAAWSIERWVESWRPSAIARAVFERWALNGLLATGGARVMPLGDRGLTADDMAHRARLWTGYTARVRTQR